MKTKLQIPNSKLQRSFKLQASNFRRAHLGIWSLVFLWSLVLGVWSFTAAAAESAPKKIVLIAGRKSHAPDTHEYEKGARLFQHCLDTSPDVKGVTSIVITNGWPEDPGILEDAATILLFSDGSDHDEKDHPLLVGDRLKLFERLMKRGCGYVAVHYTTFTPLKYEAQFLDWLGGYYDYETGPPPKHWWSQHVVKDYQMKPATPGHPIARGLQAFPLHEEYYFQMRFRQPDPRRRNILSFGDDDASAVAWAVERADGGRGFGYTGGHFHRNWENENVRRMLLNALLWTAKIEVPTGGVRSTLPPDWPQQFTPAPKKAAAQAAPASLPWEPVDHYEPRQLEGWRVLVNKSLLASDQTPLCDATLKLLDDHLYRITRAVPAGPLAKLRQIPIWVELAHPRHACMCYHESPEWLRAHDMNPDKAGAVELANATTFLKWTREQPWMVLHELAHGYHHRFLTDANPGIKDCYEHAVASKTYEAVLRINGRTERHYALNNAKEYFAEATEAFFGTNDFYPFVRGELKEHDPAMFALLEEIWGTGSKEGKP